MTDVYPVNRKIPSSLLPFLISFISVIKVAIAMMTPKVIVKIKAKRHNTINISLRLSGRISAKMEVLNKISQELQIWFPLMV